MDNNNRARREESETRQQQQNDMEWWIDLLSILNFVISPYFAHLSLSRPWSLSTFNNHPNTIASLSVSNLSCSPFQSIDSSNSSSGEVWEFFDSISRFNDAAAQCQAERNTLYKNWKEEKGAMNGAKNRNFRPVAKIYIKAQARDLWSDIKRCWEIFIILFFGFWSDTETAKELRVALGPRADFQPCDLSGLCACKISSEICREPSQVDQHRVISTPRPFLPFLYYANKVFSIVKSWFHWITSQTSRLILVVCDS